MELELPIKVLSAASIPAFGALIAAAISRSARRYKLEEADACLKALSTAEPHVSEADDLSRLSEARVAISKHVIYLARRGSLLGADDDLRSYLRRNLFLRLISLPNTRGVQGVWFWIFAHYYAFAMVIFGLFAEMFGVPTGLDYWFVAMCLFIASIIMRMGFWRTIRRDRSQVFDGLKTSESHPASMPFQDGSGSGM